MVSFKQISRAAVVEVWGKLENNYLNVKLTTHLMVKLLRKLKPTVNVIFHHKHFQSSTSKCFTLKIILFPTLDL